MRIAVVGTGYVGLVSGACFADFGHHVTCIDVDQEKVTGLNSGKIPIYEPGLDHLVASNVKEGRLVFTTELAKSVAAADAIFIAVGTPSRRGDGFADLSYVYQAAKEIAMAVSGFSVVINKSTVPVGTADEVENIITKTNSAADIAVVSNPEFLREGAAIEDFKRPDRVVIGTEDERAIAVLSEIYRPLFLNETPIMFTSRRSAELIKYAANAFLATKVTFINEMADLCEQVGADVQAVSRGIGYDKRIGSKFLNAGPGYGGSCFPKDTLALVRTANEADTPVQIVETVIKANQQRKKQMAQRVIAACDGDVNSKTICILGVSFKPNTDDMRDAPSLDIIAKLIEQGANVRGYDPQAMQEAAILLPEVTWCQDAYDCAKGADVLVIITEWDQFRALQWGKIGELMTDKTIVDLRNIYNPADMEKLGFKYTSIGRG